MKKSTVSAPLSDGGLRARGQVGDEEGDGAGGAPGAGEKIGVDCQIDGVGAEGQASGVGEVLHKLGGFLTWLGGEGEGGTLEVGNSVGMGKPAVFGSGVARVWVRC